MSILVNYELWAIVPVEPTRIFLCINWVTSKTSKVYFLKELRLFSNNFGMVRDRALIIFLFPVAWRSYKTFAALHFLFYDFFCATNSFPYVCMGICKKIRLSKIMAIKNFWMVKVRAFFPFPIAWHSVWQRYKTSMQRPAVFVLWNLFSLRPMVFSTAIANHKKNPKFHFGAICLLTFK